MMKVKRAALAVAAILAVTNLSLPVLAEEATPSPKEGIDVEDGSQQEYQGDVSVTGNNSVAVKVKDSTVSLTGDISTDGEESVGISATNAKVDVVGDVAVEKESSTGIESYKESTVNLNGDISTEGRNTKGIFATDNSDVEVHGNIEAKGDFSTGGVAAAREGTLVSVYGDVTAEATVGNATGISAGDGSLVAVNGNVTVNSSLATGMEAMMKGEADVFGDVNVSGEGSKGVYATMDAEAFVSGTVTTNDADSIAVRAMQGADVELLNDVWTMGDNSVGLQVMDDSTVDLNGSVFTCGETSINIEVWDGTVNVESGNIENIGNSGIAVQLGGTSTVSVDGEIYSENIAVLVDDSTNADSVIVAEDGITGVNAAIMIRTENEATYVLPAIITSGMYIDEAEGGSLIGGVSEEVAENLLASISYIVNAGKNMNVKSGTEEITVGDNTYEVAHIGDQIVIKPKVPDGYKLRNSSFGVYADTVVKNADGTYTITVTENGDLTFEMKLSKIATETTDEAVKIGDTVKLNGNAWIVTAINAENGIWTLASVAEFTDEQLEDMGSILDDMLSENEMQYVKADADTNEYVWQIGETVAAQYFGGNVNHVTINADPAILKA